ncbi:MAG: peptidase dimerization domain-containing protein [Rhodobacteraceae bacterium]|nr:peptidase dimerization domain-containing protein [Paracoccaceae bacterium]
MTPRGSLPPQLSTRDERHSGHHHARPPRFGWIGSSRLKRPSCRACRTSARRSSAHRQLSRRTPWAIKAVASGEATALNIVPNICTIDWEIRNLAGDDPTAIIKQVKKYVDTLLSNYQNPKAEIYWEELFSYPGLGTDLDANIISFVRSLTGTNNTIKVAFGTEGGLFHNEVGIPTVICGPGSMLQGHKPNEFISVEQMNRCDLMMANLLKNISH